MRIGLMSFAHVHAAGYASLLQARPDVQLVVADPDAADAPAGEAATRGAAQADRLGIRLVADYEELLDWQPHGVIVCAETSRHRDLVEQAAAAGAHVLCEKPLAATTSDASAMIEACTAAGVNLMTAYPVRFHPSFRLLRQEVRSGRLGPLRSATGVNSGRIPSDRRWFLDSALAGGGAAMDHTVHLADLIGELVDAAPIEVYAQANRILHDAADVETAANILVTYEDGLVVTIDCSWDEPATYPTWGGLTLAVHGSDGSATFDAFNQRISVHDASAGRLAWSDCGPDLDALMLDEFLASIRENRPPQPSGSVGLRTLTVVEAAYTSLATGQPAAVHGWQAKTTEPHHVSADVCVLECCPTHGGRASRTKGRMT
jgi:1,5-anhydro-D-fructose reductase (1,5-anhydro-D-mannitol-forming)